MRQLHDLSIERLEDRLAPAASVQAVWVDTPQVTDYVTQPNLRQNLVNQCAASGINTIYISVYQSNPNSTGQLMYDDSDLAALINSAHAHGIQVWADYGAPDWPALYVAGASSSFPMQRLDDVINYNKAEPAARFDGVMLDVEYNPNYDPASNEPESTFLSQLVPFYQASQNLLGQANISLGAAISAFWNPNTDPSVTQPVYQQIINLGLNQVVVLGYRDFAGSTKEGDGIIGLDQDEVNYAASTKSPTLIVAGLETQGPASQQTFFGDGNADMNSVMQTVAAHFGSNLSGFAVDAYGDAYLSGESNWPAVTGPTFTSAASTTFTVGNQGSFPVTASGSPTPTLSESSSDTFPSGVSFNAATGALNGTPTAGSGGTYTLHFTATNSAGSVDQTFVLTVDQAPAITSANGTSFAVGQPGSFTLTATGFPTPTLTESGTVPLGLTFTDNGNGKATLSGTPAADTGGSYVLSVTAHNGVGNDNTQRFTLTVKQPPAITSSNATFFTAGQSGSFTITTTGFPAPTLTESGALPIGVTFTDSGKGRATLGGVPAAGTNGDYEFTIVAHNGISSDAMQSFTLTVNPAAVSPSPPSSPPPAPPPSIPMPPPPPALNVPPLLALIDSLLGGTVRVNANGTETIMDSLFGIPLFVSTYNSAGNLVSVTLFGIDITFLFEL